MLEDETKLPNHIYWVSTKGYPAALDENPFANEVYTPTFSRFFYDIDEPTRNILNLDLKETSDGIHESLLNQIARRLFHLKFTLQRPIELTFIPSSKLTELFRQGKSGAYDAIIDGAIKSTIHGLDHVIFCTGYTYNYPDLLQNITCYYGDEIRVNRDFSIQPVNKHTACKLFLNNGAKTFYGPADPNLSLIAWRSANIINAAFKRPIYNTTQQVSMVNWCLEDPVANDTVKQLEKSYEY